MKWANQLSEEELKELYILFTDDGATINDLKIIKDDISIGLSGYI